MSREIVDDDIEQHLIDQIIHGIKSKGDQPNLVSRCYSLDDDFSNLKSWLEQTRNTDNNENRLRLTRENLYYLNNLLNEWQLIKKRNSIVEDREACANIKKSLKKIMKEPKVGDSTHSSSRGDIARSDSLHQEPNHPIFERNKEEVYRWSSRHGPRKIHGFEHYVMAMERDLVMRDIKASYKVFGVVGVAGIGKTTLCQAIFGRKLVKEHFCPRIWVCLSKQPRDYDDCRKEIVVRILKCLGIEDDVISDVAKDGDQHGLRKLILLLRLQLIGKRYLIILDDAWNDDEFFLKLTRKEEPNMKLGEELAYALPKGCGGTVISSSRSDALLKKMLGKDVSLQYLKSHTREIIDEIFRDTVIGYDEDEREFPTYLEEMKTEILNKCDGIPLAAKLLAKIAREQLPFKEKPPPPTSAGGGHETKMTPASGGEQLKGDVDAGGGGSGARDGEPKAASGSVAQEGVSGSGAQDGEPKAASGSGAQDGGSGSGAQDSEPKGGSRSGAQEGASGSGAQDGEPKAGSGSGAQDGGSGSGAQDSEPTGGSGSGAQEGASGSGAQDGEPKAGSGSGAQDGEPKAGSGGSGSGAQEGVSGSGAQDGEPKAGSGSGAQDGGSGSGAQDSEPKGGSGSGAQEGAGGSGAQDGVPPIGTSQIP